MIFKHKRSSEAYIEFLRRGGATIGEDVTIYSPNHTFIDEQFPWLLTIGDHVHLTLGTHILNHDYSWAVGKLKYGEVCGGVAPVIIGNNVFIGVNSVILMGTTIGNNVIIGAGSVVKGEIPSNCVVAGNPAKVICDIETYWKKRKQHQYYEASDIVREYRKRFGKNPPKNKLPAYFFLWENRTELTESVFLQRMELCGNYNDSMRVFQSTKPMFDSYELFLKSIDNKEGK